MNEQLRFPLLSAARFAEANERAKEAIRKGLQPPDFEQFKANVVSEFPRWFSVLIWSVLVGVMIFSFVISAGKQAAAAAMLFDHLPSKFSRLSDLWSTISVAFMLLLSELGAVLFLVAAGTLANSAPRMRSVNVVAWLFRLCAILCASYAIISNATITVLDPVPQAAVLQWAVSIGVPGLVLGLGIMLERLFIDSMRMRTEQKMLYKRAMTDYDTIRNNPALHASWSAVLADEMWREMTKYKRERDMLETIAGDDREVRRTMLILEFQAQRRAETLDWDAEVQPIQFGVAGVAATAIETARDSITSRQMPALSQGRTVAAKSTSVGPAVAKAKAWLAEHPDHGLSLRDAADQAGVSKDTMARAMNGVGQ